MRRARAPTAGRRPRRGANYDTDQLGNLGSNIDGCTREIRSTTIVIT
jgi:hypothetical protein